MKRTTYIIIGTLAVVLVALCVGLAGWIRLGWGRADTALLLLGKPQTTVLPACKAVKIQVPVSWMGEDDATRKSGTRRFRRINWSPGAITLNNPSDIDTISYSHRFGRLNILPSDSAESVFTCAADMMKYLTTEMRGDTLVISCDFSDDKLEPKYRKAYLLNLLTPEWTLRLPAGVELIESVGWDDGGPDVAIDGLQGDTLALRGGIFEVSNTRLHALSISASTFKIESGEVEHLHVDLDGTWNWNVNTDSARINTEYLYGSRDNLSCDLQKGEACRVVWMPQTEKAALNITLRQATEVVPH
ncbi:MAG: hypothetical protein LBN24_01510 [Mediterranea sp.]|jgi:hypothetical protein|nr:hypothetical protein [Mediterranea sp.]